MIIYSTALFFTFVGLTIGYFKWYKPPYNDNNIIHNYLVREGLHGAVKCPICGKSNVIRIDSDIEELLP